MEGPQGSVVIRNLLVAVAHMDCGYTDLGCYKNLPLRSSHFLDYDAFEAEDRTCRAYHRVYLEH